MTFDASEVGEFLEHFGIKRKSGRYKYGTGERPFQGESESFRNRMSKAPKKPLVENSKDDEDRESTSDSGREATSDRGSRDREATSDKGSKDREATSDSGREATSDKGREATSERVSDRDREATSDSGREATSDRGNRDREATSDRGSRDREATSDKGSRDREATSDRRSRADERAAAREERRRQQILRSPRELRKHQYEFSPEEIRDALQRFEWDKAMSQYSQAKVQAGRNYIENAAKITEGGTRIWNAVAATYNSINRFDKSNKNAIPMITGLQTDKGTSKDQVLKWFKEFQKGS